MSLPLPARVLIPVANPATAEELIRLGADLMEARVGELTAPPHKKTRLAVTVTLRTGSSLRGSTPQASTPPATPACTSEPSGGPPAAC